MRLAESLSEVRLQEILKSYGSRKIGVIGDLALDAYWYADMTRSLLSRETPHFPRPVVRETLSLGAGANVALNLKMLGTGEVVVFSVLGEDWRQASITKLMISSGIATEQLIVSPERITTAYVKPILNGYDSQQEDSRLDFENDQPLSHSLEDRLINCVQRYLPSLDALVIADQFEVNGIITDRVRGALNSLAREHTEKIIVVDSRRHINLFQSMILKPNWTEAVSAIRPDCDISTIKREQLVQIGKELSIKTACPTFITLSEDGVLVCAEGAHRHLPAAPAQPPLDPVGAGDAFIATLTATLAVGATPWEAGAFANLAAAIVVEKLNQTGTVSPDEIIARYELAKAKDIPL
jgi:rfaE bifunctional protein kinase chain/domain